VAFLFEAFVVGLVVPAAPYGPASYYNYDRVGYNAFIGERSIPLKAFGLTAWLDYDRVLQLTGLPIEFWRMLSTFAVTFFVVRGLGVFEAIRRRQQADLERERDRAQERTLRIQKTARENAEKWTDALVAINRRISMLANVDTILLDILGTARSLLRSDYVGLGLYNEDRSQLVLKCHSHTGAAEIVSTPVFIQNRLILQTVQKNQSYRSQKDVPEEALENVCPLLKLSAQAVAIVPIELENQSIGALWVARCKQKKNGSFSGTDLIWLECLADQVVIAIQHGLMTSKLQSLSVVEERARIAREMHDGLAQVLGYMNLQVQTLQALFQQGKQEELQTELRHMRQAIKNAHADVRENILSLRTTLANEKGLVSALGEYLDEFSIQAGLEASFSTELTEAMELASIAEVQLVCIMQEALANVRKHANATRVDVCLRKVKGKTVDQVCMEIVDNGIGFSTGRSRRTFGLQTMRERASTVGGTLEVHSSPGEGTSIICRLPCLKPDEMRERSVFLS
jgi:nitrate/nitrite-specific signal transduction histidine kinase